VVAKLIDPFLARRRRLSIDQFFVASPNRPRLQLSVGCEFSGDDSRLNSIYGVWKIDYLRGLKEHVIVGDFIPAGTGLKTNQEFHPAPFPSFGDASLPSICIIFAQRVKVIRYLIPPRITFTISIYIPKRREEADAIVVPCSTPHLWHQHASSPKVFTKGIFTHTTKGRFNKAPWWKRGCSVKKTVS
jgi:hypothetical protein